MTERADTSLGEWYLARLRQKAANVSNARVTPRTLVETDYNLIRELVSKMAVSRERRAQLILQMLINENKYLEFASVSAYTLAVAGCVLIFCCLL